MSKTHAQGTVGTMSLCKERLMLCQAKIPLESLPAAHLPVNKKFFENI